MTGIVRAFRDDDRVLCWDLFNEPDNPNPAYGRQEPPGKAGKALALLQKTFGWAREAETSQPLTAGVWRGRVRGQGVSEISRLMLAESDVISFHSYADAERVEGTHLGIAVARTSDLADGVPIAEQWQHVRGGVTGAEK